jgi:hypothetical protein
MIRIIAFVLCSLATTPAIADDNWTLISKSDSKTYEARIGSLRPIFTASGEPAAIILLRVVDIATKTIRFVKHYVRIADCRLGYGKIGEADLSGRPISENQFVFDGGNVASTIAQTICMGAELLDREMRMEVVPEFEL